jgi:hypothetical protein
MRFPDPDADRSVLLISEQYADGMSTKENLKLARNRAGFPRERMAVGVAWEAAETSSAYCLGTVWECVTGGEKASPSALRIHGEEGRYQAELIRDIFGHPFRPVSADRRWLSSHVLDLARTMYDSRDFAAMPILADALQEAGCEDADVLAHCRGGGPHVRGCWVVDLVLGKT